MQENTPAEWKIPPLLPDDHKYRRGHVLVYGGAVMTGATHLAVLAAAGAGISQTCCS
jgi:NAD(P)H-hydrate epimerase